MCRHEHGLNAVKPSTHRKQARVNPDFDGFQPLVLMVVSKARLVGDPSLAASGSAQRRLRRLRPQPASAMATDKPASAPACRVGTGTGPAGLATSQLARAVLLP